MEMAAGNMWLVRRPAAWPPGPEQMSITVLGDLEACPRRWALGAAEYADIWKQPGYPRPIQQAALEGAVVHLSLQSITSALVGSGCLTLHDETAVAVLRELGGYSEVILRNLQEALARYEGNPRAERHLDLMRTRVGARIPELRRRVQKFLLRLYAEPRTGRDRVEGRGDGRSRRELQIGAHPEVELRAPTLGWRGFADLLSISSTSCEIRDFKTGQQKAEHALQVRTYALLWARDGDLNPRARLADRLVLSYEDADVVVPAPSAEELEALETELRRRTAEVQAHLREDPPEARPSRESCAYCGVRQLCDDYWRSQPGLSDGWEEFVDLQVRLVSQHGATSWDVAVESPRHLASTGPALLRLTTALSNLQVGQRLRVLNLRLSQTPESFDEPSVIVATMGESSETFLLGADHA